VHVYIPIMTSDCRLAKASQAFADLWARFTSEEEHDNDFPDHL
jgi:hypothetical protein